MPRLPSACAAGPAPERAPGGTSGVTVLDWVGVMRSHIYLGTRRNELSPATAVETCVGPVLDAEV